MKTHSLLTTAFISSALLLATGCPAKNEPKVAQASVASSPATPPEVSPSPLPTTPVNPPAVPSPALAPAAPDPAMEMLAALEAATAEKREGLSAVQQRMDRSIDDLVMARKSAGANVSLATDEKLDNATEDFAEKLRMLTLATPDTWETAKHNTTLALQNVRSAFAEVMNSPQRQ